MIKWGLKKIISFALGLWLSIFISSYILFNFVIGGGSAFSLGGAFVLATGLFFAAGLPAFIFLLIFWNIVIRPGIIIGVMVPYIIFRFLVWAFIVLPLYAIGQSSKFTFDFFNKAEKNLWKEVTVEDEYGRTEKTTQIKKTFVALFLGLLMITFWFLGPSEVTDLFSFLSQATLVGFLIILVPIVVTVLISGLLAKMSEKSEEPAEKQPKQQQGVQRPNAVNMAAEGLRKGRKGAKTYNNLKKTGQSQKAKSAAKTLRAADVKAARIPGVLGLLKAIAKIPKIGPIIGGGIAGVSGGTAVFALLIAMIILFIIWLVIAVVFFGISYFILQAYMPALLGVFGPMAGAGDLAGDYGGWIGDEASSAVPHYDFTAERNAIRMAGARVSCALEGPACLREYQMNNTERPGSESVGQSFGLEIENFDVNDGHNLDVSGRGPEDDLRVGFNVYNPVRGLKGIDAHGVEYRVTVDNDRTECQTEWTSLGGEFAQESDIDDDSSSTRGTILAGDFAQPLGGMEGLTLGECGLMQPSLGTDSNAELEVRYNYSSQSTLQIQAMSEDYMLEQGMRPDPASSDTADTPVKTFINTRSPIIYRDFDGTRRPDVFPVSIGFETDDLNVGYEVIPEDLVIDSSTLLSDAENTERWDTEASSASCDALELVDEENNIYELADDELDLLDTDRQYTLDVGPSPIECDMLIEDPESISPSGETVNLQVDANYTVTLSSRGDSFETERLDCARGDFNCPLIVTEDQEEYIDEENDEKMFKSTCDSSWSIDASRGCTVIEGDSENPWQNPEIMRDGNHEAFRDGQINNNEQAYRLSNLIDQLEDNVERDNDTPVYGEDPYYNNLDNIPVNPDEVVAGVDPEDVDDPIGKALIADSDGVHFEEIRAEFCHDTGTRNWFDKYLEDRGYSEDEVIFFSPEIIDGDEVRSGDLRHTLTLGILGSGSDQCALDSEID